MNIDFGSVRKLGELSYRLEKEGRTEDAELIFRFVNEVTMHEVVTISENGQEWIFPRPEESSNLLS